MSLWSSLWNAAPTSLQLLYCHECGYSALLPCRDPETQRASAANRAPLSQAAAPPVCPRCGSAFVQTTTNPSEFPGLYNQTLARAGTTQAPTRHGAPTPVEAPAAATSPWSVLRSVLDTFQNSAVAMQREAQQTLSGVFSGEWEATGTTDANGLPAECQHFTADDVLSTFEQYPHGLPRAAGASATDESSTTNCPICLDDCQSTTSPPSEASTTPYVVKLHCQHVFHRVCLLQWIDTRHFLCPLCRQPMIYK